jgi:hypothetical protein
MGLRVAHLRADWDEFVDSYERIVKTVESLFRVEITPEEMRQDLESFKQMRSILKQHHMI